MVLHHNSTFDFPLKATAHYVPHFSEKRMIMEINWGLGRDTNPSSNIKSYITYVSDLPSGREAGEYLALDLGGTNFRFEFLSLTQLFKI